MKKIAGFLTLFILFTWLLLGISLTKAGTTYPSGIIFASDTAEDGAKWIIQSGTPQSFPGGKVKSSACNDSEGYESFPAGTLFPDKAQLKANIEEKYPNAFKCTGNPRYFGGGELIAVSADDKKADEPETSIGLAEAPDIKDIDLPESKYKDIPALIAGVITWLLGIAGALAVIAIIYSGIMYMTSGGDQTKAETAKKNLIWAITGIVIILLSFVIINWVANIFS